MFENILFLTASFIAAILATLAGFGSSTILIPVAGMFMDLKTAVFLVACFHLFNNTFKIKVFWNKIDFKIFLLFGIPSIIFAFIGAILISNMPVEHIRKTLAIFLIIFSIYSFIKPKLILKETKTTAIVGGGLSGFLAGLIGLGGAIRSTFLVAFNLSKERYVATSAMIAFVIDLTRIPAYLFTEIVQDGSYYILLPFLLFTAYLGVKTGKVLLGKISQETFRKIVSIALFLVGIKLLF